MKGHPAVAAARQSAAILICIRHRRFSKRRYAGGGVLLYLCFLLSVFCFYASGQTCSIDWYKIAGIGPPAVRVCAKSIPDFFEEDGQKYPGQKYNPPRLKRSGELTFFCPHFSDTAFLLNILGCAH
jgi:hypothetical protein